jgi:hypothetical protein
LGPRRCRSIVPRLSRAGHKCRITGMSVAGNKCRMGANKCRIARNKCRIAGDREAWVSVGVAAIMDRI